jgi:hypothetical protein
MPTGDVLTYQENDRWFVIIEGTAKPVSSHDSRHEAVEAGSQLATIRGCEHVVANFVPRGYAVQADLGAVTGGQASLYEGETAED